MAKPDATKHNPDPVYLRGLLELLEQSGLNQRQAAEAIGITSRALRYYLADTESKTYRAAPYPVQFALECLAKSAKA